MKGVVFTEFLDLVEEKYGYEMVDRILNDGHLASGGAYTAIGTYPHAEMAQLVGNLSRHAGVPVPDLLKLYGKHLFGVFTRGYGHFFREAQELFEFLESIEQYIHVEVRKLYPDAELPRIETRRLQPNALEVMYHSERRMGDFAEGLLEAACEHFGEKTEIHRENVEQTGSTVRFTLVKQTA